MIVRIEVHQQTDPETYWQLKRCQAHIAGTAREIGQPPRFHPMRFLTLEDAIRHAKSLTVHHLVENQHREIPDQIDWRIMEECPRLSLSSLSATFVPESQVGTDRVPP